MTSDPVAPDLVGAEPARHQDDAATARSAARVRALIAADPVVTSLGIELTDTSPGRAVLRMPVRPDMVQGLGICHGGILFTLCDAAFAAACNGHDEGPTVGAAADITWVSAAYGGDVLVADAHEHTRYGRNGITDVTVRRERDGAVVARFRGRSLVLRAEPSRPQPTEHAPAELGPIEAGLERQEW